jgi:hypothetical protein
VRLDAGATFGSGSVAHELFQALDARMAREFPRAAAVLHKTQVSYDNGRVFAAAWIPYGRHKDGRDRSIMVSFSLSRKLTHPRVTDAIWQSANRCVHHVTVSRPEEIDDELMNWLAEADSIPRRKKGRGDSV